MDDTDRELMRLLRLNAREPVTKLAQKLGIARATVQDRLARLTASGAITKFTIATAPYAGNDVAAYIFIKVNLKATSAISRKLAGLGGIREVYRVTGDHDFLCLVDGSNTEAIDGIISRIMSVTGVERTSSGILLARVV